MNPEPQTQIVKQPSAGSACTGGETLPEKALQWGAGLLFLYFGLRLAYFALNISSFVPPDEVTHAGVCGIFSKVLLFPDNTPESYQFGLVTNSPWLYYFVMGKLVHLNFFGLPDLVFLRLMNMPIAFGTVFFTRRTLLLFTENRLTQLLLIAMMTNTAMFSLLSASVSYDNLVALFGAMSIYYLLAFLKQRSGGLLAAALLSQLAGALTKSSFLPLALVLDLILVVREAKNLPLFPGAFVQYLKSSGRRGAIAVAFIVAAVALNLQLYGGNFLKYGTLAPTMAAVVSPEKSMEYRIGARERIFNLYTEGKISYMDALQMAGTIRHPGDKSDTFYMLMNYENLKANPALWLTPLQYVKLWVQDMTGSILGIKGHISMFKDPAYMYPVYLLMLASIAGFALRWRPSEAGLLSPLLAVTFLFYAGFLLYKVNYMAYLYYGVTGITLQGRYLFPVLGAIYVFCSHHLIDSARNRQLQMTLAAATAILFIAYDFPWFLAHATQPWFR